VLQALNADLLHSHRCYFGGGTAIVLRHGEYRESADIDFLVSDIDGYRELREVLTGTAGINALTHLPLKLLRKIRADQYGIRTYLDVEGAPIKLEFIHEGRITLDVPGTTDQVCGVTTLSSLDMATSTLLANADRWADRSTFCRDLIDLAMLTPSPTLLNTAIGKAATAYGTAIERCLSSAVEYLADNPRRLGECMSALQMFDTPEAVLVAEHHEARSVKLEPTCPRRGQPFEPVHHAVGHIDLTAVDWHAWDAMTAVTSISVTASGKDGAPPAASCALTSGSLRTCNTDLGRPTKGRWRRSRRWTSRSAIAQLGEGDRAAAQRLVGRLDAPVALGGDGELAGVSRFLVRRGAEARCRRRLSPRSRAARHRRPVLRPAPAVSTVPGSEAVRRGRAAPGSSSSPPPPPRRSATADVAGLNPAGGTI